MTLRTIALIAALLAAAAGCSSKAGKPEGDGKTGAENSKQKPATAAKRIGISVQTLTNPFFKLIADTVTTEAAKHGYKVEVRDGEGKVEKQNDQVKEFIAQGFDAIIICPRNTTAIGQVIRDANTAGIPVFTIDTVCEDKQAKVVFHVGTDNEQGGHVAGIAMIDALKSRGGGEVAILQFQRVDSCVDRVKGFTAEIENYNKTAANKIKIVGRYECEGDKAKGQAATRDALNAHQKLAGDDPEPLRHQVWELPVIEPIVTEYQQHRLSCRGPCGAGSGRGLLPCARCCRGQVRAVAVFVASRLDRSASIWRIASSNWSSSRSHNVSFHGPAATNARLAINWPNRISGANWLSRSRRVRICLRFGLIMGTSLQLSEEFRTPSAGFQRLRPVPVSAFPKTRRSHSLDGSNFRSSSSEGFRRST